ncbi:MAG TPA: hypothetical protein VJ483_04995 [Holophagaceae bacterium]|nr:hypothetical protein [Holophagaceae bacterium]
MSLARTASLMALASCALCAQITTSKMDEAKRLSLGWKKHAGGRERGFQELSPKDQLDFLIGTARNNQFTPNRDAALVLLSQWPYEQGLAKAVKDNPVGARALASLGYVQAEPGGSPARPWVHGLGLHLEPSGWRLQVIPAPAFLASQPWSPGLPKALGAAPVPSVLIRLDHLRPGLAKLADLVGGPEDNLVRTAAAGSRAGFLLTHVQAWLARSEPALGSLADRNAWILHYGHPVPRYRRSGVEGPHAEGTLVFLPGALPARTELSLGLLRLNPFSAGARVRIQQLSDGSSIDVIRGSGGLLYLQSTTDGTWIGDHLSSFEARLRSTDPRLAQSEGWGRVAMSGAGQASASLWMIPRQSGGAAFETALAGAHPAGAQAVTASLLKAAPRNGAAVVAVGSGPTFRALQAFFTVDRPFEVPTPEQPALAGSAVALSPEQQKSFAEAKAQAAKRAASKEVLRRSLDRLAKMLDGQGAAMHWNGWTPAPPMSEAEKAALRTFRKQGYWTNARQERMNQAPGFGGFGEPGLTPSLAVALPLKMGQAAEAELLVRSLFTKAFKGAQETRTLGSVTLRRMKTSQAFAPAYALVGDVLVLASDDNAAAATIAGLQGQAPTLADLPPRGWGQLELDGPRMARETEQLLLSYLGAQSGKPRYWWWDEPAAAQSGDEVAEEVASTFGPFLNLVKKQGRLRFSVDLDGSGFELRPL